MSKSFGQSQRKFTLDINLVGGKSKVKSYSPPLPTPTVVVTAPAAAQVITSPPYTTPYSHSRYGYNKHRKWTNPCFNMISTGTCLHGDLCGFIHDPRCAMLGATIEEIDTITSTMAKHVQHHEWQLKISSAKSEDGGSSRCYSSCSSSSVVSDEGETDGESVGSILVSDSLSCPGSAESSPEKKKHYQQQTHAPFHYYDRIVNQPQQSSKHIVIADAEAEVVGTTAGSTRSNTATVVVATKEAGFFYPPQYMMECVSNEHFYSVIPQEGKEYLHEVESLWVHFLSNFNSNGTLDPAVFFDEYHLDNIVTQKPRLSIFQVLSQAI